MSLNLPPLETPQYFIGQRLDAERLNTNVATEQERRWFHNRALHGIGISAGLTVRAEPGDVTVTVSPGHAIDADGHDLIVVEPVTLQVPAVAGAVDDGNVLAEGYFLNCRWPDPGQPVTARGPCDAVGPSSLLETPVIEFVKNEAEVSVVLGTIDVAACAIHDVSFARRRVLGSRVVSYVNGGEVVPSAGQWQMVTTVGDEPVRYGLRTTIDTSVAGFSSVPNYQARVSGPRAGTAAQMTDNGPQTFAFVLWAPDAYVVDAQKTSLTIEVAIPTVHRIDDGLGTAFGLEQFLGVTEAKPEPDPPPAPMPDNVSAPAFRQLIAEQLAWSVTWIGVEGTL